MFSLPRTPRQKDRHHSSSECLALRTYRCLPKRHFQFAGAPNLDLSRGCADCRPLDSFFFLALSLASFLVASRAPLRSRSCLCAFSYLPTKKESSFLLACSAPAAFRWGFKYTVFGTMPRNTFWETAAIWERIVPRTIFLRTRPTHEPGFASLPWAAVFAFHAA